MRVESLELRDSCDVERVEVCDTMREVTVITVQLNEVGDTLKQTVITDRTHSSTRDRTQVRLTTEKQKVLHDTVYIQRDSIVEKGIPYQVRNEGSTGKREGLIAGLTRNLKWLFFVLIALTALILVIRIFLLKR